MPIASEAATSLAADSLPVLLIQAQARFTPLLQTFLARHQDHDERLNTAIDYAMANGGKRVRPALVWGACLAVGGSEVLRVEASPTPEEVEEGFAHIEVIRSL